jgi:hypothetical protein
MGRMTDAGSDLTVREASSADARPRRIRSAVTNGSRAFVDGDGNSAWYRRRKDILELHLDDMGGRSRLSEAQISLASRASSIEVELEQMEGRLSKGQAVDLDAFTRAASHLRRILETLGVPRAQRDVTPARWAPDVVAAPSPDLSDLSGEGLGRLYSLLDAKEDSAEALRTVRETPRGSEGSIAARELPEAPGQAPEGPGEASEAHGDG